MKTRLVCREEAKQNAGRALWGWTGPHSGCLGASALMLAREGAGPTPRARFGGGA